MRLCFLQGTAENTRQCQSSRGRVSLWMCRIVDTEIVRDQLYQISWDMVPPHQVPEPDGENRLCLHDPCTGSSAVKKHGPIYHLLGPTADVQGIKTPCVCVTSGETPRTDLAATQPSPHTTSLIKGKGSGGGWRESPWRK